MLNGDEPYLAALTSITGASFIPHDLADWVACIMRQLLDLNINGLQDLLELDPQGISYVIDGCDQTNRFGPTQSRHIIALSRLAAILNIKLTYTHSNLQVVQDILDPEILSQLQRYEDKNPNLPFDDRKVNRSPTSVPGLSAHLTQARLPQQDNQPTILQRSSAKRNVSALYRQNAQTEALPAQSGQPTPAIRPYTRSQRRVAAQPQKASLPPISFSTEAQSCCSRPAHAGPAADACLGDWQRGRPETHLCWQGSPHMMRWCPPNVCCSLLRAVLAALTMPARCCWLTKLNSSTMISRCCSPPSRCCLRCAASPVVDTLSCRPSPNSWHVDTPVAMAVSSCLAARHVYAVFSTLSDHSHCRACHSMARRRRVLPAWSGVQVRAELGRAELR